MYQKVYVEITNSCNLSCSFCPSSVDRESDFMEIELFERICGELRGLTKEIALHIMGEPLLHPNLGVFLDIAKEHNLEVNIVTNGFLVARFKHLVHDVIRQINFSLHSFDANTQKMGIDEYLAAIFDETLKLLEQREKLYINYRLWNNDTKDLRQTNHKIIDKIEARFGVEVNRSVDFGFKKSKKIKDRLYLHLDSLFEFPSLAKEEIRDSGFCYGLSSHFGILANGNVVPCCLDTKGAISLGNIRSAHLVDILNSKRAQNMKEGFAKNILIEELCQRCGYISRFGASKGGYNSQK